jgi:tetratricopeptide (TPR) repeat protein
LGRYNDANASLAQAEELAKQSDNNIKPILVEIPLHYAQLALSERHFPEAKKMSQQALKLAGTQYESVAIQAKYTLGLAQAFSGEAREGKKVCEEAVEMAKNAGDVGLLSRAWLALAETLLENKDAQGALTNAMQAQESFSRGGKLDSEWRAWVIASRASHLKGDERAAADQLAQANNVFSQLRQKWGDEVFTLYLSRPDIQFSHKQLGESVPVAEK